MRSHTQICSIESRTTLRATSKADYLLPVYQVILLGVLLSVIVQKVLPIQMMAPNAIGVKLSV
jgi:hypothetical protein